MDSKYSDVHPPRIGHINCVLFIDRVCLAPAWTFLDGAIISAAPTAWIISDGAIISTTPAARIIFDGATILTALAA
jgi:hypothetical protein